MDFNKVRLRDGGEFRLLEIVQGDEMPVKGAYKPRDTSLWRVNDWSTTGSYYGAGDDFAYDLVPIPETRFFILATENGHKTLAEAQASLCHMPSTYRIYEIEIKE